MTSSFFDFYVKILIQIKKICWKDGRVVNCTNFENWRGFAVTEGSNPSLSEYTIKLNQSNI